MLTTNSSQKTTKVKLPHMHPAQSTIKRGMGRFNVVCCGRRFGKDVLGQDRAIFFSRGAPVGWFAPSYRMLSDNFRMLSNTLAPIVLRKQNNERLELLGGGSIDFWSLENPDRARGRKYKHVIINEAAMVAGLSDAWNMVIRPTLIDLNGSADFMSTPRGLNDFYRLWMGAVDLRDWERFRYTTYDNPYIPHDEIDALKLAIPERVFSQEVMAEFLEDGAYFQGVNEAAIIEQPETPAQHTGHYLGAGLDWAISEDYTVLTIACRDCNRVVDWDRFNQIDFTYQRRRIVDKLRQWNAIVLPERNSIGTPNIEMMMDEARVIGGPDGKPGFNTTRTTKPALIQDLASAIVGGFKVPSSYADELLSYQVEVMADSYQKFNAPAGMHDDRVISLALAYRAITNYTAFSQVQPLAPSKWLDEKNDDGGSYWKRY
jgi:hypothetical protein